MSSDKATRRARIEKILGHTLEEVEGMLAPGAPVHDEDNPPLTAEDWDHIMPIEEASPEDLAMILAAFPKTKVRGKQKAPTKVPVSLRLSSDVLDHFKAEGPGWQTRIDDALRATIKKAG